MATQARTSLQRLCEAVAKAEAARFSKRERIAGERIRRLALGLPRPAGAASCSPTPYGIRIVGATIRGRIDLDNANPCGGGPVCPIEFEDCLLDGGFSGAHAHLSRLSFRDCRFRSPPPSRRAVAKQGKMEDHHLASIELSGAALACDLDLVGARPDGDERKGKKADEAYFARKEPTGVDAPGYFWVRLRGTRIDGNLDLSRARLRAPAGRSPGLMSDPPVAALNLTQAELCGDFMFVNGARARGRILARECHIKGDVWMSGAKLNGLGEGALLLQSATVDGIMMLDSRHDRHDRTGTYRWFKARGEIDCFGLRLGGGFTLRNAEVYGSPPRTAAGLLAKPEKGGRVLACLSMQGATIGGSVVIDGPRRRGVLQGVIHFAHLEVSNRLVLDNLDLGIDDSAGPARAAIDAPAVEAKELLLKGLRPLDRAKPQQLAADFTDAVLGKLKVDGCTFNGFFRAAPLTCSGDAEFAAEIATKLDLERANIAGSLDISGLKLSPGAEGLSLKDGKIGQALRLVRRTPAAESPPLHGIVDLSDLSCDTLDDQGGSSWGREVRFKLNHFVYRQATWAPEAEVDHRKVWNWFRRRRGRAGPPAWQVRLDWIYQQFAKNRRDPPSAYRVRPEEYEPQPFEQAITIARAEGREDCASQFEMRKRRIEWQLFNLRNRWPLGYLAIILACGWLWARRGFDSAVADSLGIGLGLVLILMFFTPTLWKRMHPARRWVRVAALVAVYALIVVPVFFSGGWETRPLEFLIAAGIFTAIRLVSWLSHGAMRFMFGYLRRPALAVVSLVFAFLIGWAGVAIANDQRMLVIDVEPVASYTLEEESTKIIRIGNQYATGPGVFMRNVPCGDAIRSALYALDVLIPLIDLRQESRCEVGRAGALVVVGPAAHSGPVPAGQPAAGTAPVDQGAHRAAENEARRLAERQAAEAERQAKKAEENRVAATARRHAESLAAARAMPLPRRLWTLGSTLVRELSALPGSEGFWETLKALYAIAGWFIVSLSILTFAHANRARPDPV